MVIGAKHLCSCCYLYLLLSCNNLNPKVVGLVPGIYFSVN
jgi:hypothetical protein